MYITFSVYILLYWNLIKHFDTFVILRLQSKIKIFVRYLAFRFLRFLMLKVLLTVKCSNLSSKSIDLYRCIQMQDGINQCQVGDLHVFLCQE